MRFALALLPVVLALSARAAAPDPLASLIAQLSAPLDDTAAAAHGAAAENGARLARIQAGLIATAEGFEALRGAAPAAASREALAVKTDPALRPFAKDRDSSLNAIYRTLAVVDFTWALRFPRPSCPAAARRTTLLQSPDGLFVDPDVGALSPWMARLLGPSSFGAAPEEALDQASAQTGPTASAYEKMRAAANALTEKLDAGAVQGAERAKLYCERADLYEQLARAHRPESGPTLASLESGGGDPAASVFLLTTSNGNGYDELGAGFLVKTASGNKFVTDASIVRGRRVLYAFAHPASGETLGPPIPVLIERTAPGPGPAVGRLGGNDDVPGLTVADAAAPRDELVRGLGPLRAAGPWTTTQGLVTKVGAATFSADALLSVEMAGSPVLNEGNQAAGLMIRRGGEIAALRPEKLREFLDGGTGALADAEFAASRNGGSASLLTAPQPPGPHVWSAPDGPVNWASGDASMKSLFQPRP